MDVCKVSVIIPVYQSHEIVRRQLLHLEKMNLPIEVIIVDDNSNPPIEGARIRTLNKMAWTQGLARNDGAKIAKGEKLLFTDIDHILSKEALEDAINFEGEMMMFNRKPAILDENGDLAEAKDWNGKRMSVHGNTFVIPKKDFFGYKKGIVGYHPAHKGGDDVHFMAEWRKRHRGIKPVSGRDIYLWPTGRFHKTGDLNPDGLFHNLSQEKQERFDK